MSSHHVVREKQEPALLILNLGQFGQEHLGQLLEWSPTIVVSEEVYAAIDLLGIKIDGVLASSGRLSLQSHSQLILSGNSYLQSGLQYFVEKQYPALNIIDTAFDREIYSPYCSLINIVVFVSNRKIFPVRSGFAKWKAAGEKLELFPPISNLGWTNLEMVGENEFRVIKDGFYTLSFDDPFIFVAEEL